MPAEETYKSLDRFLYFATALGADKLQLMEISGYEAMSELFRFQLEFNAKNTVDVKFEQLIGKDVSFGVNAGDYPARHFSGVCVEVSQGSRGTELTEYSMVVVPRMWMLTQTTRSRIFQQINIPDILKKVLTGIDAEYQFEATYEKREYCVQYRETDFDFASRLMEEEGMYYYFKFTEGSHKLVVTDKARLTTEVADFPTLRFDPMGGGSNDFEMRITEFRRTQFWRTGKVTLWDHHFQLPHKHNEVDKTVIGSMAAGTVSHKLLNQGNDKFEFYEYPGDYARWFDGIDKGGGEQASELGKISSEKTRVANIRMQQEEVQMLNFLGAGDCRNLVSGHKFTLDGHYNGNGAYIVTSVSHSAREGGYRSGANQESHYENTFTCIPQDLKFRAPRRTPRPRVAGCQTAVVVGPSGEEIFTDKYGRVKVQFHWDRDGKNDQDSSCWLRVATPWSGKQWGTIHIPRMDMEVLVDFLEGDPDRPIIIGSLYNANEMPPYTLPDNKTQSGIKSRSSKQGGPDNYNEIRFEDKKGSEMVTVHAEKDMEREVENDDRIDIGNDQKINVHHDRTETVDNDEKIEIKNNRTNKIGQKHKEEIGADHEQDVKSNKKVKIGMNYNIETGMNVTLKAGVNLNLEAGVCLTMKAGASSLQINPGGIQIAGTPMLMLNCPGPPPMPIMPVIMMPIMPGMPAPPAMPALPGMPAMPNISIPGMALALPPTMPQMPTLPPLPSPAAMGSQMGAMVNSALSTATNVLSNMSNTFLDQVTNTASSLTNAAANMGQAAAAAAGQVANQVQAAVEDAKSKVGQAVEDAKKQVEGAIDSVAEGAQAAVSQAAEQVANLQNQAATALDQTQQQLSDAAAQVQQIANQAAEQGQQALNQAADQANQVAQQAQQVAQQAQEQLQQTAAAAEQAAQDAMQQGQQALNATSQQVNALAQQGQQAAQAAQQAAAMAAQQTQQVAQQAMAQAQEQVTGMANSAQQAAQQASQAANQAAQQASQAAQAAAQNASQMAQQTQQQMQQATQQAAQQVQGAAQEATQQVAAAANQATQQAAQAGQMAQQTANQVSQQVGNAANQASEQIGQTANQAFTQVGNTADQAAQGMQNAFQGIGR
jgi:type VI secretion system secreted protein VgrG